MEKKRKAGFPRRGEVRSFPFVPAEPKQEKDESDKDFERRKAWCEGLTGATIDVEYLGRDAANAISYAFQLWYAEEERRIRDLERAGAALPAVFTLEGTKRLREVQRAVIAGGKLTFPGTSPVDIEVSGCVRRVAGVLAGDLDLEAAAPAELAELLDDCQLLGDAVRIARAAQTPTPQQLER